MGTIWSVVQNAKAKIRIKIMYCMAVSTDIYSFQAEIQNIL